MMDIFVTTFACVANIALGGLTMLRNPRSPAYRVFFSSTVAISGWALMTYLSDHAQAPLAVTVTTRLTYPLAFLAITLMAWFTFIFPRPRYKPANARRLGLGTVLFLVAGSFFSYSGLVAGTITITPGVTNVDAGPLYWEYLALLLGAFAVAIYNLLSNYWYKHLPRAVRSQIAFILIGIGVSFIAVLITNGILPVAFNNWNYAKIGPALTVFMVGAVSVAIIRHRLFDIRMALARAAAYVAVLATIAILYGVAAFGLGSFFFPGGSLTPGQKAYNITVALFLALTFQPLQRFFGLITDRIFYRNRYDSQAVLNHFSAILVSELHLDRILKKALTRICEDVHIQFAQIVVYNNDRVYRIEHSGPLPRRLMVAPELAKLNHPMLVADELDNNERKITMDKHGIRVSVMLRTREEFVGYLLLGDKLSGDIYSSQDIELLEIIGKELAVAILNAKAYAEIQDFNLTLQARVDHATNRLRVANRHLKELDHAKDEFISMASHQLRTPLTTIKGYLSMMLEGDAGKLTSAQKDFVGYAFGSSERMVNLISDLLNVSRLSAGRFLIQTKPTDMVQMVDDEVRQLKTHATAKGIKLIFEHPAEPIPPAEIDDNKTRQVIMNFIDNAIYYTQQGSVTVVLQQAAERIRFEVRDTGIGVPPEARRKLFSKFFRAENAQVIRPDGTGLGLYLAKRVIEDQGGTIIFESVQGEGSTFGFELPYQPVTDEPQRDHARTNSKH